MLTGTVAGVRSMAEDAEVEGKKLEIIEWASERFYEGGFHATGIDSVMAGSGISKRTVYKYFSSKEALIEAVLDHYGSDIVDELFTPARAAGHDPRRQIMAFFDIRKAMIDENPIRGCLGIKASQEYVGKHDGIAERGKNAAAYVERAFIDLCEQTGLADPVNLGKQISILFQGSLLLSQVFGDSAPFVAARAAVASLLNHAAVPSRRPGPRTAKK
ncbi:TetR/AcrR family transcriptional regulator [Acidisoma cellulosilytica]|uniref:TetR/AcrR family transcriptional regulator n=1 Tax=Acidisoma cellulosilyticum TaxID=2802395 RepID=A0A963Z1L2_9PROT|nr:TetR/AcrR family transcriptional regulator [Acidisoma cellulosilyticum]MCB8881065.1 TetR/AcrR family transcriptional regulator [Acidisoma cellulosilyticum]